MPTREEIVEWLLQSESQINNWVGQSLPHPSAIVGYLDAETFRQRAAQVAAMHCETCKHYTLQCYCSIHDCVFASNEGCFHHEPKNKE